MTVTMHDVAKAANVSITTVSHVLNNTRPIAPETRKRVLKAVQSLDYYKNTSARMLVRGFSNAFGLIISDIEIHWPSGLKEKIALPQEDTIYTVVEGKGIVGQR